MKGRRNVQVSREDFNLLLLIVVFVVFQDHFLSITATMMDFCWKHSATPCCATVLHIFFTVSLSFSGKYFLQRISRYWRHSHPARNVKTCFFSSFQSCHWKNSLLSVKWSEGWWAEREHNNNNNIVKYKLSYFVNNRRQFLQENTRFIKISWKFSWKGNIMEVSNKILWPPS